MKDRSVYTAAVHAGESSQDRSFGERPTVGPIYASTTFQSASPEDMEQIFSGGRKGYTYSRHANPTVEAFAQAVADLEGGALAVAYSSGMAAVLASVLAVPLRQGDAVLASQDLYGASANLLSEVLGPLGISVHRGNLVDLDEAERLIEQVRPRAILVETISNPLLRLVDGPALAKLAHASGAALIVDNTFATPILQRPLDQGADYVVHSATKYLAGHGDVVAGLVLTRDHDSAARLHRQVKLTGSILAPFAAWLAHRGLKTLPLRFLRQCDSAWKIAQRLRDSGQFERVVHPLLDSHPDHPRAVDLYPKERCGAVVTLDLGGDRERVYRFLASLKLVLSATTVGDIYTLCLYPAMASHRNMTPEGRLKVGITESTVRIAVGIEDPDEIADDILAALEASRSPAKVSV